MYGQYYFKHGAKCKLYIYTKTPIVAFKMLRFQPDIKLNVDIFICLPPTPAVIYVCRSLLITYFLQSLAVQRNSNAAPGLSVLCEISVLPALIKVEPYCS